MNKKYKPIILAGTLALLVFLFPDAVNAQVRIDNFNVVQRTIPSTSSNVDFRLTISQQDLNFRCPNGYLDWIVWYDAISGGTTFSFRGHYNDTRNTNLSLSPNPLNLDFRESNFTPNALVARQGYAFFHAALACRVDIRNLGNNLAVSSPIRVSVSSGGGGGQEPPGGGQEPGEPVDVSFNIPNPIQAESLVDLAKAIGKFLFQIAIPIAVIVIIYAGILFLTSGGSKEKITKARQALWYAVIGLAVILIGQGFFTLIKSILNLGN